MNNVSTQITRGVTHSATRERAWRSDNLIFRIAYRLIMSRQLNVASTYRANNNVIIWRPYRVISVSPHHHRRVASQYRLNNIGNSRLLFANEEQRKRQAYVAKVCIGINGSSWRQTMAAAASWQ